MHILAGTRGERVILHPGEYRVTRDPITISTLLGSCVSVCLYDPVHRIMGMNHFLLAHRRYARELPVLASEAGRYGIHAMELLVNGLLRQGAERRHLKAKAFGGGNVLGRACAGAEADHFLCVGSVNVRFVQEFLGQDRIPLVASDLGGNVGRQIHFVGTDYSVYMKKIPSSLSEAVIRKERTFWSRSLQEHEQEKSQAEFW